MSLENRILVQNSENLSQYGDVERHKDENCGLEDVFFITTNVVNDNLTRPMYLNMPLLDDEESPCQKDLLTTTLNGLHNNNYMQYQYDDGDLNRSLFTINNEDQTDFNIFFIEDAFGMQNVQQHPSMSPAVDYNTDASKYFANHAALAYVPSCNSSMESILTPTDPVSADDDDISEFLVFHERKQTVDDPKLKAGCVVKLGRNEVRAALKEMKNKRKAMRKRKCNSWGEPSQPKKPRHSKVNEESCPISEKSSPSKRKKPKKYTIAPSFSPKSNHECPKIILKFVRLNPKKYECVFITELSKKVEVQEKKKQEGCKDCSVVLSALPTQSSCQPLLFESESTEIEMNSDSVASQISRKTPEDTTETGRIYDVECKSENNFISENATFDYDLPLDLTLPKNQHSALDFTKTRYGGKGNLLYGVVDENITSTLTSKGHSVKATGGAESPSELTENKDWFLPLTERFSNQILSMEVDSPKHNMISLDKNITSTFTTSENDNVETTAVRDNITSKLKQKKGRILPLSERFSSQVLSMEVDSHERDVETIAVRDKSTSKLKQKKSRILPLSERFSSQVLEMGEDTHERDKISLAENIISTMTTSENHSVKATGVKYKSTSKYTKKKNLILPSSKPVSSHLSMDDHRERDTMSLNENTASTLKTSENNCVKKPAVKDESTPRREKDRISPLTERFSSHALSMEVDHPETDKTYFEETTSSNEQPCRSSSCGSVDTTHLLDAFANNEAKLVIIDEPLNSTSALASIESTTTKTTFEVDTTENVPDVVISPKDDDNCSVTSELSIFAPSLSDILDSEEDDSMLEDGIKSTTNTNAEQKMTNFRIPKLKKTVDKESGVGLLANQRTILKTNEEIGVPKDLDRIEELGGMTMDDIFRATIRHSPKMLSPVKDLDLSLRRDSKPKDIKARKKFEAPKAIRPSRWRKSDHKDITLNKNVDGTEKSNENSLNYIDTKKSSNVVESSKNTSCPLTRTDISQQEDLDSVKLRGTEIKKFEKLVIKVSGDKARNVSLADEANHDTSPDPLPTSFSNKNLLIPPQPLLQPQPSSVLPLPVRLMPLMGVPLQYQPVNKANELLLSNHTAMQNELLPPNNQAREIHSSFYLANVENKTKYRQQALQLFQQPCLQLLSKQQCDAMPCRFSHVLPSPKDIYTKIHALPNEMVLFIYRDFIVKNVMTFERYFPLFCELFGCRKLLLKSAPIITTDSGKYMEFMLLIKDCEMYKRFDFLECIFDGLLMCDISNKDALLYISDCCQICSASDQVILVKYI